MEAEGLIAHDVLAVVLRITETVPSVLLWQRAREPQDGRWALPGGRLGATEDVEASVRRHLAETGSAVADRLLEFWHEEVRRFVKVMPKDYKRVLQAARAAEERGANVDEAIMAASHG